MIKTTEIDLGEENPRQAIWNNGTLRCFSDAFDFSAPELFGKIARRQLGLHHYVTLMACAMHNFDSSLSIKAATDLIDHAEINLPELVLEMVKTLDDDLIGKNQTPPVKKAKAPMPKSKVPGGTKKNRSSKPGTDSKETPLELG